MIITSLHEISSQNKVLFPAPFRCISIGPNATSIIRITTNIAAYYLSEFGHTKDIAGAIAEALGIKAKAWASSIVEETHN